MRFLDREEAGIHLARALAPLCTPDALVLALPRGGVPVGWQVARLLGVELEVVVARRVCAPNAPDMALGAVAEGGLRQVYLGMASALGIEPAALAEAVRAAELEVERRVGLYRAGRPLPPVMGRTVFLVDDVIARGAKMKVVVEVLRARRAGRLVMAAPVAAAPIADLLAKSGTVVSLVRPATVSLLDQWYQEAGPVDDAEVMDILARPRPGTGAEAAV